VSREPVIETGSRPGTSVSGAQQPLRDDAADDDGDGEPPPRGHRLLKAVILPRWTRQEILKVRLSASFGVPPGRGEACQTPKQYRTKAGISCETKLHELLTIFGQMTRRGRRAISHLRAHNDDGVMMAAMMTAMMSNNDYLGH